MSEFRHNVMTISNPGRLKTHLGPIMHKNEIKHDTIDYESTSLMTSQIFYPSSPVHIDFA